VRVTLVKGICNFDAVAGRGEATVKNLPTFTIVKPHVVLMNIAYLILAHNQPGQLVRLLERLNGNNVHFFIHVDKKSPDIETIKKATDGFPNAKVVSNHKVYWMGFNMVLATIDLLELAYRSGIDFKYFVLLSGLDYPIKSNEYIHRFFEEHHCDFIDYHDIPDMAPRFLRKVQQYHYYDIDIINPRSPKRNPRAIWLYFGLHKKLISKWPVRRFFKNYVPCFGSQWFALTGDSVAYILDFVKNNKRYMHQMRYSEGPDELFFQTILYNSHRKENLVNYDKLVAWKQYHKPGESFTNEISTLRYMDWSENAKSKPAVLDDSYFPELANSIYLFARKVDEHQSATLMEKIDRQLLRL
jgi:Core-2/I-Branching enzyme